MHVPVQPPRQLLSAAAKREVQGCILAMHCVLQSGCMQQQSLANLFDAAASVLLLHLVHGNAGSMLMYALSRDWQAFGMMGWRVGYIAYQDACGRLTEQLTKVQDTIPICPPQLSQHVALAATTRAGRPWVQQQLSSILANR